MAELRQNAGPQTSVHAHPWQAGAQEYQRACAYAWFFQLSCL